MYRTAFIQVFTSIIFCMYLLSSCRDTTTGPTELPDYMATPYQLQVPSSYPVMTHPEDNPITVEGVALGHHLFFDKRLSGDNTMACASCHLAEYAFTDQLPVSTGIDGIAGTKSAMSLIDIGYTQSGLFWDGRVSSLESQALLPVEDPIELHHSWSDVIDVLSQDPIYVELFRKAFNIKNASDINKEYAVQAIAQYERALVSSGQSKYDRVLQNQDIFTDEEFMGFDLFFDDPDPSVPDGECGHCHNAPTFSSDDFFNNGITLAVTIDDFPDIGFGKVTGNPVDYGKFRAPTLRNIEYTAPYMHDGRFQTLEEVMDHYASGGHFSPTKDPLLSQLANTELNEVHKKALIAFMKTLSDPDLTTNPLFSSPF